MTKKTQYDLQDTVWIHINEPRLIGGTVVHKFKLPHEGEFLYVIQLKTGIDAIYEVRFFSQISSTATGPIQMFTEDEAINGQRYLKKVGVVLPIEGNVIPALELSDSAPTKQKFKRRKKATLK